MCNEFNIGLDKWSSTSGQWGESGPLYHPIRPESEFEICADQRNIYSDFQWVCPKNYRPLTNILNPALYVENNKQF